MKTLTEIFTFILLVVFIAATLIYFMPYLILILSGLMFITVAAIMDNDH